MKRISVSYQVDPKKDFDLLVFAAFMLSWIQESVFNGMHAMNRKCPGQDSRNLRPAMYRCTNCGADVEMFSDELRIRCHRCKEFVYKENTPSCIDWCRSARECIGEEKWDALRGAPVDSSERED